MQVFNLASLHRRPEPHTLEAPRSLTFSERLRRHFLRLLASSAKLSLDFLSLAGLFLAPGPVNFTGVDSPLGFGSPNYPVLFLRGHRHLGLTSYRLGTALYLAAKRTYTAPFRYVVTRIYASSHVPGLQRLPVLLSNRGQKATQPHSSFVTVNVTRLDKSYDSSLGVFRCMGYHPRLLK